MDDRFNTLAGWVLFAGIVALGASLVAGENFHEERPEEMGYPIEGVVVEGEGGAEAEKPIAFYLASADPAAGEQVFKKCTACHNADKGGANALGPNLWGMGRTYRQGSRIPLLARPLRSWWDVELGHDERLAGEPEEVRARHQDDLRGPQQSAGSRERHRLPELAQRRTAAAASRSGRGRRRPDRRQGRGDQARHRPRAARPAE